MDQKFLEEMNEGLKAGFAGWDFSWLEDKMISTIPSWSYREIVIAEIKKSNSLLDMGTGGGEFLAYLPSLPEITKATEGYKPNLEIARRNLSPKNVMVHSVDNDANLPFAKNSFDIIINRHESYNANEVKRILKPKGKFITQQVGNFDNRELNWMFRDKSRDKADWSLEIADRELSESGFTIIKKGEEFLPCKFLSLSAIIYYLKVISWQIPGLDLESKGSINVLHNLYQQINEKGNFKTLEHRFYIMAQLL